MRAGGAHPHSDTIFHLGVETPVMRFAGRPEPLAGLIHEDLPRLVGDGRDQLGIAIVGPSRRTSRAKWGSSRARGR